MIVLLIAAGFYLLVAARGPDETSSVKTFSQSIDPADCPVISAESTCFNLGVRNDGTQPIQLSCALAAPPVGVKYVFENGTTSYEVGDLAPNELRTFAVWATASDGSAPTTEVPSVSCK